MMDWGQKVEKTRDRKTNLESGVEKQEGQARPECIRKQRQDLYIK